MPKIKGYKKLPLKFLVLPIFSILAMVFYLFTKADPEHSLSFADLVEKNCKTLVEGTGYHRIVNLKNLPLSFDFDILKIKSLYDPKSGSCFHPTAEEGTTCKSCVVINSQENVEVMIHDENSMFLFQQRTPRQTPEIFRARPFDDYFGASIDENPSTHFVLVIIKPNERWSNDFEEIVYSNPGNEEMDVILLANKKIRLKNGENVYVRSSTIAVDRNHPKLSQLNSALSAGTSISPSRTETEFKTTYRIYSRKIIAQIIKDQFLDDINDPTSSLGKTLIKTKAILDAITAK